MPAVCVCVCVYIYIYIHTHTHIYVWLCFVMEEVKYRKTLAVVWRKGRLRLMLKREKQTRRNHGWQTQKVGVEMTMMLQ